MNKLDEREYLWAQKYRPKSVEDCILPAKTKAMMLELLKQNEIPHLILSGLQGTGKTTLAYALGNDLGADVLYINASLENGIDIIRTTVQSFASTVTLADSGAPKIVIMDETDGISPNAQSALRGFLEAFSSNCRFIFTTNNKNKIIAPIQSRCTIIDFKIDNREKQSLAASFLKRIRSILDNEKIQYDIKAVAGLIARDFPDFRKTLNNLQRYSTSGKIDADILVNYDDLSYKDLYKHLSSKNFTEVRKWIGKNSDIESSVLFRALYDNATNLIMAKSMPQLILILADYQHRAAFVVDHEINIAACCVEIMSECQFSV